ncbi:MAG: tetratricopeptide repeat protein [Candidatus Moranbacteria bacterium]|nr:tetratricopeptide repeat protein [Candidatus Moranbacteria bacterium]
MFISLILPPIIIVVAVALLIIFLARAVPKSEREARKRQLKKNNFVKETALDNFEPEITLDPESEIKLEKRIKKEKYFNLKNFFGKISSFSFKKKNRKNKSVLPSYGRVDGIKKQTSANGFLPNGNGSENFSRMGEILLNNRNAKNKSSDLFNEESELVRQISVNPRNPESYRRLGDFYVENDRLKDARECYKYVLRLDPRHKRAQLAMKRLDRILG